MATISLPRTLVGRPGRRASRFILNVRSVRSNGTGPSMSSRSHRRALGDRDYTPRRRGGYAGGPPAASGARSWGGGEPFPPAARAAMFPADKVQEHLLEMMSWLGMILLILRKAGRSCVFIPPAPRGCRRQLSDGRFAERRLAQRSRREAGLRVGIQVDGRSFQGKLPARGSSGSKTRTRDRRDLRRRYGRGVFDRRSPPRRRPARRDD